MSRAGLILVVVVVAALLALWLFGPFGSEEPAVLPEELDYPSYYRAEASGSLTWEDDSGREISVPGRMHASYVVYPDDRAAVTHLSAWLDDVEIENPFSWWQSDRREFRCTTFSNAASLTGALAGGRITVPAGVVMTGRSYRERGPGGECRGPSLSLEFETESPVTIDHDPEGDRFAVSASFAWSADGSDVEMRVEGEGHFLNRPPVAVLSTAPAGEGEKAFGEGCPGTGKGEPPVAIANGDDGLTLALRSTSYDPDGPDTVRVGLKNPRFDLRLERWLYSDGGRFRHLGDGPAPGEVLFATGREHRLLLVAVDRSGSQDRAFCHFRVVASEDAR